jgi:hypothetical protein
MPAASVGDGVNDWVIAPSLGAGALPFAQVAAVCFRVVVRAGWKPRTFHSARSFKHRSLLHVARDVRQIRRGLSKGKEKCHDEAVPGCCVDVLRQRMLADRDQIAAEIAALD